MALVYKNEKIEVNEPIGNSPPTFTRDEIIWLMNLIKDSTFKGQDVQLVYESVVKLQLMLNKQ